MSNIQGTVAEPSNIVVLRPRSSRRPIGAIQQHDLEEYIFLSNRAREASKLYEKKKNQISKALQSGAEVEDGVHRARLEKYLRAAYRVKAKNCTRLVVK